MIEFGGAFQPLPYVEDGITFTNLPGANPAVIGTMSGDGHLISGTNFTPIKVRVTGSQPFDLISLDLESLYRTWRIESSAGAVVSLTWQSPITTINLAGAAGWTNLSYFDIIHDPGEPNGTIRVDNIVFNWLPDFNGDSLVDGGDLDAWKENWGEIGATHPGGDADDNGNVDGSDFLIWQRHAGQQLIVQSTIPEPTALVLGMLATLVPPRAPRKFAAGERGR